MAQEGFLVTGYFARRSPILIPWAEIQSLEEMDMLSSVRIAVDYEGERRMSFYIPKEALAIIQQHVPAAQLHQTSFSQLIKDRLNQAAETTPKD